MVNPAFTQTILYPIEYSWSVVSSKDALNNEWYIIFIGLVKIKGYQFWFLV
jgi:hypothetical protein